MTATLAVSGIAWEQAEEADVARLMRRHGCGAVELAPTGRWPKPLEAPAADVAAYRRWWEDQGLPVVALQALLFGQPELLLFESAPVRARLLDYLKGIVDLGAALGAKALVFGS